MLEAEPLRVLGRELDLLAGDRVLERRRDLDLGCRPDRAVGAEREARRSRRSAQRAAGVALAGGDVRRRRRQRRRRRLALGPANSAAADLLERDPARRTGPPATSCLNAIELVSAPVSETARLREISAITDQPARTEPGCAIAIAQPLEAAVGVYDRALLLGVGLGREDHVRVLAEALGEHRGVRDDQPGAMKRALPQGPVGLVADRIGLEQVQRGDLAGGGGPGDLGRRRGRLVPRSRRRHSPDLTPGSAPSLAQIRDRSRPRESRAGRRRHVRRGRGARRC